MANKEIKVKLSVDGQEYETQLAKAEKATDGFAGKAIGYLKGLGALAVGTALAAFFKSAVEEGAKAEEGMNRLGIAVRNAGGNYATLSPQLENTVNATLRLSTATDDDLRDALTRMITLSGDVTGSQKNLGLVTDVAAFKQISLGEAADLVGKAMTGNTKVLGAFGDEVKKAKDPMEALRATVKGYAENEATTFSGRLQQVVNQFGEFEESVGRAILQTGAAGGAVSGLADFLGKLATWIDENSQATGVFMDALTSVGAALFDTAKAIWEVAGPGLKFVAQVVGGTIVVALQTASFAVREFIGGWQWAQGQIAEIMGALIEKGGAFLKLFGIDLVANTGASLKKWGESLVSSSKETMTRAYTDYKAGMGKLVDLARGTQTTVAADADKHEKVLTDTRRRGNKERKDADAEAVAKAEKARADANDKALKQLQQLGAWLSKEQQKQGKDAEANAKTLADTLGVNLGKATADALQLTTSAMERLLVALRGKIPIEQWQALNAGVQQHKTQLTELLPSMDALKADVEQAKTFNQQFADASKKHKPDLETITQNAGTLARAFLDAGAASGVISSDMAAALNSVVNIATALPKALGGDITSLGGVITGLANVIVNIGTSPAEQARLAIIRSNIDALQKNTQELGNFNLGSSGKTFNATQTALQAAQASIKGLNPNTGKAETDNLIRGDVAKRAFISSLLKQGVSVSDALELLKEIGVKGLDSSNPADFLAGLGGAISNLGKIEFGQFSPTSFEDQLKALTEGFSIFGTTDEDNKLVEFRDLAGKFSPAIAEALAGDLSTADGRAAAVKNLQALFAKLKSGGLSAKEIGVTSTQFLSLLQTIIPLLQSANGTLADGSSIPGLGPSTVGGVPIPNPATGGSAAANVGPVGGLNIPRVSVNAAGGSIVPSEQMTGGTVIQGDFVVNQYFPDVTDANDAAEQSARKVAEILGRRYALQKLALGVPLGI